MSNPPSLKKVWLDFLAATQFLTRIPVHLPRYEADSLSRSVMYFPCVGLLIGGCASLLHMVLAPHLSRTITALVVLTFLIAVTGCLHEDGLADAADGLGGGWNRDQALTIMRDSRIGSYGAVALTLSLLFRYGLLSSLPVAQTWRYLMAAHVLCRWTTLPLSFVLPAARAPSGETQDGQGARVAHLTSRSALIMATVFSLIVVVLLLRKHAILPITMTLLVTLLTGVYYRHRLGGITGDCFGATNQLTEIVVYLCGVAI